MNSKFRIGDIVILKKSSTKSRGNNIFNPMKYIITFVGYLKYHAVGEDTSIVYLKEDDIEMFCKSNLKVFI